MKENGGRVWHLWQQKNNIAVGRRARTHAYEAWVGQAFAHSWRRGAGKPLARFILVISLYSYCFAHFRKQKRRCTKKKVQIFADFSLFSLVSTHIVLEGNAKEQQQIGELTKRKAGENQKHNGKRHNAESHNGQKKQWEKKRRKKKQSAPNEFDTLCKDLKD